MKKILVISLIFVTSLSFSQIIEKSYFPENNYKNELDVVMNHIKVEDGIVLSGVKKYGDYSSSVILKIDLNGNVVWSTHIEGHNYVDFPRVSKIFLGDDGYIYGYSRIADYTNGVFMKVDLQTGDVIWKKSFFYEAMDPVVFDYDSLSYFLFFHTRNGEYYESITEISKLTGDTLKITHFPSNYVIKNAKSDNSGNIYISKSSHIIKFNGKDFNNILWDKEYFKYNEWTHTDEKVHEINNIYIDNEDEIFLFGTVEWSKEESYIAKISSTTGDVIFSLDYTGGNTSYQYITEDSNNIYVSLEKSSYEVIKFDKNTGEIKWISEESVDGADETNEAALSMDIDCSGNLYLTGYSGNDYSYSGGKWGIMKIDGNNGSKINDLIVTNDTIEYEDYDLKNKGMITCVFGNIPLFIGRLQVSSSDKYLTEPIFVTIDSQSGELIQKKRINSDTIMQSATVDIIRTTDNIYDLKQLNNKILIEKRDTNGFLIWKKEINNSIILARNINYSDNSIYVVANNNLKNYYNVTTSNKILLYKLNATNGDIVSSSNLDVGLEYAQPIEIEADSNVCFVFYQKNDSLLYFKWEDDSISNSVFLDTMNYDNYLGKVNIAINDSAYLMVSGNNALYKINKNTLQKSQIIDYPNYIHVYDIYTNSDTLFLSGRTEDNKQNLISIDLITNSIIWNSTYNTGYITKICQISDTIITLGKNANNYQILYSSKTNGEIIDTYTKSFTDDVVPLNIKLNDYDNTSLVAGYLEKDKKTYDGFVDIIKANGEEVFSKILYSTKNKVSYINPAVLTNDSCFLIGGSTNESFAQYQGFTYKLKYINLCLNPILINVDSMDNCNNGLCNGNIYVTPHGGAFPYTYNWSTSSTESFIDSLCPGEYSLVVVDSNLCSSDTAVYTILIESDTTSFTDTINKTIEACLFDTSVPVDSASIKKIQLTDTDSLFTSWVFWQSGHPIYLDVTLPYIQGKNLVYLEIICNARALHVYKFYGIYNSSDFNAINIEKIIDVEIFPNPAKDFVQIKVNNNGLSKVSIIDISGKFLKEDTFNKSIKLKTAELSKGVYVFKIETNNEVITKKIVIE